MTDKELIAEARAENERLDNELSAVIESIVGLAERISRASLDIEILREQAG